MRHAFQPIGQEYGQQTIPRGKYFKHFCIMPNPIHPKKPDGILIMEQKDWMSSMHPIKKIWMRFIVAEDTSVALIIGDLITVRKPGRIILSMPFFNCGDKKREHLLPFSNSHLMFTSQSPNAWSFLFHSISHSPCTNLKPIQWQLVLLSSYFLQRNKLMSIHEHPSY